MPAPSTCACGAPWERILTGDGPVPVWRVRHVGGRDQCRALPPPKPSEVLPGRTPIRWNPAVGTIYPHDDHEILVWDIAGDGLLELECDCGLSPMELAAAFGIPVGRLRSSEIEISRRVIAERAVAENPDDQTARAILAALPAR